MNTSNIIIIVNGEMRDYGFHTRLAQSGDYIISVDGGCNHALRLGLTPDLIVGDLDSIDPDVRAKFETAGCAFRKFPAEKDESDLQLALDEAVAMQPAYITVLGALGKRFDHAFGNIGLLYRLCGQGPAVRIVDETHTIQVFDRELAVEGEPGDYLSLFPLTPAAAGVTTSRLKYPLRDETLYFGDTRGLSNELLAASARVTVRSGKILAVHIRHRAEA